MHTTFLFVYLQAVVSQHGLLTTVAYKLGPDQPTVFALEVRFYIIILNVRKTDLFLLLANLIHSLSSVPYNS